MLKELAKMVQEPSRVLEDGRVLVNQNYDVLSPKDFALKPHRNVIKQVIVNKEDFINFVNEYKTPQTKMFYDDQNIKAIFNYPSLDKADHGDSFASLSLIHTETFIEFKKNLNRDLSQKDFIRLLKRLEPYITSFDGQKVDNMSIIEIAEDLSASTNINSIQRNTKKAFILDTTVKAGNSSLTIPRIITFSLPVYTNDLELKANFDVELFLEAKESAFIANLICYKYEQIIDETVRTLMQDIKTSCTDVPNYMV